MTPKERARDLYMQASIHYDEIKDVAAAIEAALKEERKACLEIVNAVHPADGVEGCGCSAEIAKRIKRRNSEEGSLPGEQRKRHPDN